MEAEKVGFGASGRNGGWLSGLMPGNRHKLARRAGRPAVADFQRALINAVSEVEKFCVDEAIDADVEHGGTLAVATTAAQMQRLTASVREDHTWGLTDADVHVLDADGLSARLRVAGAVGGTFSPHCARIQPAKLVLGLASVVERLGVRIHEGTCAESLEPHRVITRAGEVRARWVVQATEGFTATLPGQRRRVLPMNSSVVVTEPLGDRIWADIGWARCETLRDAAHAYVYLQRTADGRIAIGGRGNPYRFGSRIDEHGGTPPATVVDLAAAAARLFPALRETRFEHSWSGVLGVARDWCPFVLFDGSQKEGGLVRAGGYVGDGVSTSYLAGRTIADLILGSATARTRLPWVNHRSRGWEPEPLRWLGVHSLYRAYRRADRIENRRPDDPRTSRWALAADRLAGRG